MKITKGQFRALLIVWVAAAAVGGVISFTCDSSLPQELQRYAGDQPVATVSRQTAFVLGLVGLVLGIVATVGLFVFWKPARPLTLTLWAAGFVITGPLGPTVELGWTAAFYELSAGLSGVVLALAYFSPVRDMFERRSHAA